MFKGSRTYLHGTSMFDNLLKHVGVPTYAPESIRFMVMHMTTMVCEIVEKGKQGDRPVVAAYQDTKHDLLLIETETGISQRVEFDELQISKTISINGAVVEFDSSLPGFSMIESLVCSYRELLVSQEDWKYLFVDLRLQHLPTGMVKVEFKRKKMKKFFEGWIFEGDEKIGRIIYSGEEKSN